MAPPRISLRYFPRHGFLDFFNVQSPFEKYISVELSSSSEGQTTNTNPKYLSSCTHLHGSDVESVNTNTGRRYSAGHIFQCIYIRESELEYSSTSCTLATPTNADFPHAHSITENSRYRKGDPRLGAGGHLKQRITVKRWVLNYRRLHNYCSFIPKS